MRNDLQAAIEYFETYSKEYQPVSNSVPKYILDDLNEQTQLYRTALSALRDVQARQKGCKYCAINDWERKPLATFNTYFNNYEEEQHEIGIDDYEGGYRIASTLGNNGPSVDVRFCPNCGRNLTEKEGGE